MFVYVVCVCGRQLCVCVKVTVLCTADTDGIMAAIFQPERAAEWIVFALRWLTDSTAKPKTQHKTAQKITKPALPNRAQHAIIILMECFTFLSGKKGMF